MRRTWGAAAAVSTFAFGSVAACAAGAPLPPAGAAPTVTNLVGTFSISSGHCSTSGPPTGSYFEIEIAGTPVPNPSSSCSLGGDAYTPLTQGSRGLVSGSYELDPSPTFD